MFLSFLGWWLVNESSRELSGRVDLDPIERAVISLEDEGVLECYRAREADGCGIRDERAVAKLIEASLSRRRGRDRDRCSGNGEARAIEHVEGVRQVERVEYFEISGVEGRDRLREC